MTLGDEGKEQARVFSPAAVNEILEIFAAHGHDELDTARMYGEGTSERMLSRVGAEKAGFKIVRRPETVHLRRLQVLTCARPERPHSRPRTTRPAATRA